MNQQEIEQKANKLVEKAEHSIDGERAQKDAYETISRELNSLSREDQLAVVRRMEQINHEHRKKDSMLPDIEFATAGEGADQELTDIKVDNDWQAFVSNKFLGTKKLSEADVFDTTLEKGMSKDDPAADLLHDEVHRGERWHDSK